MTLTGRLAAGEASEVGWSLREATTAALKENQAAAETAATAGGSFERVAAAADTISRVSAVAAGMSREEAAETAAGLAGKLAADRALATVQSSEEAAAAAGRAPLKYWFSCCNSKCRPGCGRSNICSRQATSRNSRCCGQSNCGSNKGIWHVQPKSGRSNCFRCKQSCS